VSDASAAGAFALGFALGAAPGPVQVLILSETAKRGLGGGLRVMLGANLTLLAILVVLALGFASVEPGDAVLRVLRVVGGLFLVWLGTTELRSIRREAMADAASPAVTSRTVRLGPTGKGIVSVLLNPGAWIFFATTASAVIVNATTHGGTADAVVAVVAMAVGVSCSDLTFTVLGSGGRKLFGDRGLLWIRTGLAALLIAIGAAFVWRGAAGG
jgi:threonine/homoserine/homoserine lactone efflux protein